MTVYATRRDLYRYGLPRGTLGGQGRLCASVKASTDTFELEEHGFETDDDVLVRAVEGGTLSAPLAEGTTYFVIRLTSSTFKLAATAGGAAINLTTDGESMLVTIALPIDAVLEFYSRWVDGFLPAHLVPLAPDANDKFPTVVTAIVAELSSKKLQHLSGVTSESVNAYEVAAKAQLERWAKGIPLRDERATAPANLAVTARPGTSSDPRGWGSGCLP